MIVVTGVTGKLGAEIVDKLLQLVPPAEVAASVRKPQDAQHLAARGVAVRLGDYDRPETLERAFASAHRLLLVSASGIEYERRVAEHGNAIEAAVRAKVGHVYYTSLARGDNSVADVMKAHIETERLLKESGLPFTILQNGVYAEALETYLGEYWRREVVIPADGPINWVSRTDLAAGTAVLLHDGGHRGETLRLTGQKTLTIRQVVEILSTVIGRPIRIRTVSVEEYIKHQAAAGRPFERARQWASTYAAMARGELSAVDPFLPRLLGRPLRTLEEVVKHEAIASASSS